LDKRKMTNRDKRRLSADLPQAGVFQGSGVSRRLETATRLLLGPLVVAALATSAVFATLSPSTGPGITCDELYHVLHGKRLVMAWHEQGLAFFSRDNIARNFPWTPDGPPVHPPLGNWILGWTDHWFDEAPNDPMAVSLVAARFAPALAYGLLVLVVGGWVARRDGPLAGTVAAAATALVPRLFGHAHLAALDMFTTLFCVAAVLAVVEAETRGARWWQFALAGVVWGLAMLTRLHGVLLLPPVVVWLAWRRLRLIKGDGALARLRGLAISASAWACSGAVTLFLGWPWLWLAPISNLKQFLGTGMHRQAIHVFYAGHVWADWEVPWHYPWVMFVVTLPLGFLALGLIGLWTRRHATEGDRGELLLAGSLVWFLGVFSWPGVPVYDGVRLFLLVFPLWAVFVAIGAKWLVEHCVWGALPPRWRVAVMGLLILLQGLGVVVYHPCQLSHYSLLTGGLWGAERLGFEVSYWGDSVTEPLLAEAARRAPGETVVFGPSLAPFQPPGVVLGSPSLLQSGTSLVGWEQTWRRPPAGCRFGIFYHRRADLAAVPEAVTGGTVAMESRRQGVWLARLIEFSSAAGGAGANQDLAR
jgi:hypothetical protein